MAIGITGCMATIGAIEHAESIQESHEQFRMLAVERYQEVAADVDLTQGGSSGDFTTWNLPGVSWTATVTPTGTTNLDQLDVTVTDSSQNNLSETVSGLVYVPSTTSSTTGATGNTSGGSAPATSTFGGGR